MRIPFMTAAAVAGALLCGPVAATDELGRLFFTPAQRATLDAGKQLAQPARSIPRGPAMKLDGIVRRSDGETVVWMNGQDSRTVRIPGFSASSSAKDPAAARVRLPGVSGPVEMRVGDSVDPVSGKVSERLQAPIGADGQSAAGSASSRTDRRR